MLKKGQRNLYLKKFLLLISFGGMLLLLTGCWDRWEINDLALVTAAAIDKKEDNQIELSIQIFVPKALSSGGAQAGQGGGGATTVSTSHKGVNIADALSKLQGELPRKIFWGQCKVFIFGEDLAREGIRDHLDFLLRHPQPRERAFVFVSKGKAKNILQLQTRLERFSAETVREIVKLSIGMKTTLQDLDEMLMSEAQAAALPYIKIETEKKSKEKSRQFPKISGTAVFKKDKMVGSISAHKTRGILWLRDEIKEYTVTAKPQGKRGDLSLNPVSVQINLIPQIKDEKWKMTIKVKTEGAIVQNRTNLNLSNPKSLKIAEKAYAKDIKKRIESAIKEAQYDLKADIVGFAKEFHHKYPKEWKRVKHRWDEQFSEVKVEIDVEGHIRREGNINIPMELKMR
ncbi:Ger(x)C family spore germination protein [Bacillus sp. JJ1503]|uniref:Ger(x)C family spore germination protein n=1 Tax=Bacillus sp. JJ1503 TaxID=3122956 RepID=UPI003000D048